MTESNSIIQTRISQKDKEPHRDTLKDSNKMRRQSSSIQKMDLQAIKYSTLYIFCIPLSYKEQDIGYVLTQHHIKFRYVEWKLRQDIQYLFVQLTDSITANQIYNLDLFIDRYPLLIAGKSKSEPLNEVMLRHQLQLNFDKDIDETELMKFSHQIGGILSLIKDEYYGPRKYVVAINCLPRLKKYEEQIVIKFKNVKLGKPKYPVRLCRLQRTFTYVHMMDNLVLYEKQIEKTNEMEPSRLYN